MHTPLVFTPEYREYMWGGKRLRPDAGRTAEAWVVYEHNQVATGPYAGRSLAELAAEWGPALLGRQAAARTGLRFPLLIKLLDCAAWLSVQVHPNDEQARRLEGPQHFGKTEAWHVLEAGPQAAVLCGVAAGTTAAALQEAIQAGKVLDLLQRHAVSAGDTLFIRAGVIHALGPGLLLYEVQQTSDLTYRVWDWDRPASAGRALHIDKSLAVADPGAVVQPLPRPNLAPGERQTLVSSPVFSLELLALGEGAALTLDPHGESFHALTVTAGAVRLAAGGESCALGRLASAVVPAAAGPYRLEAGEPAALLRAWVSG